MPQRGWVQVRIVVVSRGDGAKSREDVTAGLLRHSGPKGYEGWKIAEVAEKSAVSEGPTAKLRCHFRMDVV